MGYKYERFYPKGAEMEDVLTHAGNLLILHSYVSRARHTTGYHQESPLGSRQSCMLKVTDKQNEKK